MRSQVWFSSKSSVWDASENSTVQKESDAAQLGANGADPFTVILPRVRDASMAKQVNTELHPWMVRLGFTKDTDRSDLAPAPAGYEYKNSLGVQWLLKNNGNTYTRFWYSSVFFRIAPRIPNRSILYTHEWLGTNSFLSTNDFFMEPIKNCSYINDSQRQSSDYRVIMHIVPYKGESKDNIGIAVGRLK